MTLYPTTLCPTTMSEPVIDVLHGVRVVDPFRWLEEQDSPRVRAWIDEQRSYTRSRLEAAPGRGEIRRRVTEFLAVPVYSDVRAAGDRVFFLKREALEQQPSIYKEEEGREQRLIDPAGRGEGSHASVSIIAASWNGDLLAYGVKCGGEDSAAIEIVDVRTGEILPDRVPKGYWRTFAFAQDGEGFYYCVESADPNEFARRSVRYHRLGTDRAEDREIFSVQSEGRPRLVSWLADSGRLMLHVVYYSGPVAKRVVFYQDLSAGQPARLGWDRAPSGFVPMLAGERVFAMNTEDAPNGRVVEVNLRDGSSRVVVPEGSTRIEQARIGGDRLLIVDTVRLAHRVRAFDLDAHYLGDLPLPGAGSVRFFPSHSGKLFMQYSSIGTPPEIYCYNASSNGFLRWKSHTSRGKMPQLDVRREQFISKDGTAIPITIFRKAGSSGRGQAPAILNGYGGFGASLTPEFTVLHTLLAEWGCVIGIPHIRGGSELGSEWHLAAKRHRRQTSFDDFAAAAEWMIAQGLTSAARLGIIGGSNGGLLVGAALTQRPELYRAAVSIGPLLDMLRYHRFGHAHFWAEEYGTADDPQDFAVLHSYSPYHRVRDAVPYPATLLISGDEDRRCDSGHARKMAARLQQATSSGLPVLLDYSKTRGHSPTLPLAQRIESLTDRLAFLCEQLGVEAGA